MQLGENHLINFDQNTNIIFEEDGFEGEIYEMNKTAKLGG